MVFRSLELCAGAGGQALGLERAGFEHAALFENDRHACMTLRANRPHWRVYEHDLFQDFDLSPFVGIDLLAGGLPCPPFSKAGKQLGEHDERNLFSRGIEIAEAVLPKAIMFENVRGMLDKAFDDYRARIAARLGGLGYSVFWKLLHASDFGVPQLRPRVVMTAILDHDGSGFDWPKTAGKHATVGDSLLSQMAADGWTGAKDWAAKASRISPTIVGGSKKHGGPDLGPTRARQAWLEFDVDGRTIADAPPSRNHVGPVKLTVPMVAKLQGFPDDWAFSGRKTNAYRQVGNAFPPPVAEAVGRVIHAVLTSRSSALKAA